MTTRRRDLLEGLLALLTLVALIAAVPVALATVVGWPLPTTAPAPDVVLQALISGRISPSTLVKATALVAWCAWFVITTTVAIEAVAVARGAVARSLPAVGGLQRAAARLVASIVMLAALTSRADATPAVPTPPATGIVASAAATSPDTTAPSVRSTPERRQVAERVWHVRRRETLWAVAEQALGDGRRWRDIRDRNVGRPQPDGTALGADDVTIRAGWSLALPADQPGTGGRGGSGDGRPDAALAAMQAPTDGTAPRDDAVTDDPTRRGAGDAGRVAAGATVVVERGDHLWGIAEHELGAGERWPTLYRHNRGRPQPDGHALEDPDVIRPGWRLHVPPPPTAPSDDAAATPAADDPSPPTATPVPDGERPVAVTGAATVEDSEARGAADRTPDHLSRRSTRAAPVGGTTGAAIPDHRSDPERGADSTPPGDQASAAVAPLPVTPGTMPEAVAARSEAVPTAERGAPRSAVAPGATFENPAMDASRAVTVAGLAVVAAGLVAVLSLHRRRWLRRRQSGTSPAPVDDETAELERWLRALADHDLRSRIERVQRILGAHLPADARSEVVGVRVGDGVGLLLGTPRTPAPQGFDADDDGRWWWLSPALELTDPGDDAPPLLEALVTVGRLPDGDLLLLDLVRTGGVTLTGTPEAVDEARTSWTAELATGDLSGRVRVVVVGAHHHLVERFTQVTVARAAPDVRHHVEQLRDDAATSHAPAIVVLCGSALSGRDLAVLESLVGRHDSVAIVSESPAMPVSVTLAADHLTIEPYDLRLAAPEWLSPDDWDRFGELLRQPEHHQSDVGVAALLPVPDADVVADDVGADALDEHRFTVQVLGPRRMDGLDVASDAIDVVTYLAVNGPADDATVAAHVFAADPSGPGRVAACAATLRRDDAGTDEPVIVRQGAMLSLSATVATDLTRFAQLTRGLDAAGPRAQVRRMTDALALVRGEPFGGDSAWAHADGSALRAAAQIADVAHRLAMLSLNAGDVDRAAWAVAQGRLACPDSEVLQRDRMRIADACGDDDEIDAVMRELRHDGDGWATAETLQLYRQLRRRRPPSVTGVGVEPAMSGHH